jgi:vacuolar-type H+-ATPase subunit C/Vma6
MGVSDEVVTSIMGRARETANKPYYTSGEEFIDIIKDELEFNDITNYDLEFYKKYFKELESLMRKPEPRFEYGGMV